MIQELFNNPYFYIPGVAWVVAQGLKFILNLFWGKFDLKYLVTSGGMPSGHSAVVVALATVASIKEGVGSPLFGALLVLAGIVIYDSFGVRRASGEQAVMLNRLIEDLSSRREVSNTYKRLREFLGHKPEEVVAGSLLGWLMALFFLRLQSISQFVSFNFLFTVPTEFPALKAMLILFGSLVVLGILLKGFIVTQKAKGVLKKLLNKIFWLLSAFGIFGLLYSGLAYEKIPVIGMPIFFVVGVIGFLVWVVSIISFYRKKYKHELKEHAEKERKDKWM